jgi:hypothetical protein
MLETKAKASRNRNIKMHTNESVRAEMQTFVKALASYPDRFAVNPRISFDQHRISLMFVAWALRQNSKVEN